VLRQETIHALFSRHRAMMDVFWKLIHQANRISEPLDFMPR